MPQFNLGPEPEVVFDQNGVRYIDPNPTDQIVNHEDLVVYVKLVAKSKGRSILTNTEDETIIIEKELKNVKENTNFTYTEGKNYIDTDWTNIGGGPTPLGTDLGGFGITNINIEFKSSFMPQIVIDFVDVRGASLFEQGPCSPYSMFFHLPYPVFELTVKGYYGKPVTYSLALVKFNTKFNAETGNFESKGEFVGYTYAFLADIPMGYILAANYMEDGPQILAEKWTKIVNKPEFKDDVYGLNPEEPLTIFDMVVKAKKLETELPKIANSPEIQNVAKLAKARRALIELKEEIIEYGRELGKIVKPKRPNGGIRKNSSATTNDPATVYYIRIPKNATSSRAIKEISEKNKEFVSIDNTQQGFNSQKIGSALAFARGKFDLFGIADPPNLTFDSIQNASSGFFGQGLVENTNFPDFDEYYVDIQPLIKPIDERLKTLNEDYKKTREDVQKQLNNAVRGILTFWPSIRNVFAIILSNTEVFLELMARTSIEAEEYHTNVDIKAGLGGKRNIVDLPQDLGASGGESENFTYPWPTYYETIEKTVDNPGDSGEKEVYPGENEQFVAWPEVIFCEDFIQALTRLRRDLEILDIDETNAVPGFDNYAPITAMETHAFGVEDQPNRWFGSALGVDGVSDLLNGIYNIMGENAFILGDYSMINTLSLWKSQLGFYNGYGSEILSNGKGNSDGYSNTDIDGIPPQNQGPQTFAKNPVVLANINNPQLGRYNGNGMVDSGLQGDYKTHFPSEYTEKQTFSPQTTKKYSGNKGVYNWTTKINPTTRAKMRHWGRIDAINFLQTISADGEAELLNLVKSALNPGGASISASVLKDRIKEALKEKHKTNFKEESFVDWSNSATAAINNTIALPNLVLQQGMWNNHYKYVIEKPVLTLTGPIELNYSATFDEKISANPWNNAFQGVRLMTEPQKTSRSIEIKDDEVVKKIYDLYKEDWGVPKSENDKTEAAGGLTSGMIYAAIFRKPRWVGKGAAAYNTPINLYNTKAGADKDFLQLDTNLNMLTYDIKRFRQNFYHTYEEAVELDKNTGILPDLGSSRVIFTREPDASKAGGTSAKVKEEDKDLMMYKMWADFVGPYVTEEIGSADAFVQTPLWTLNYPSYKNPVIATYTQISGDEIVNVSYDTNELSADFGGVNYKEPWKPGTQDDGKYNYTRNNGTWWGLNSYYSTNAEQSAGKWTLPLAYLQVMSYGFENTSVENLSQKTGHHIPHDGFRFGREGSFSNFGSTHVVVEAPKSYLLLLGAILWRAKEGGILNTTNFDEIAPTHNFRGWNKKNAPAGSTFGSIGADDSSDPVWFHHNSLSKPLQLKGTVVTIENMTNNDGVHEYYIRRYLGSDKNGIDRWTASGGNPWLRPQKKLIVGDNVQLVPSSNYWNLSSLGGWPPAGGKAGLTIGGNFDGSNGTTENANYLLGQDSSLIQGSSGIDYVPASAKYDGWTKSASFQNQTYNKRAGTEKTGKDFEFFRPINNINRGLFDQCRQDQMPFIVNPAVTITHDDRKEAYNNGVKSKSLNIYPHTLVLADMSSTRNRDPLTPSSTPVVIDSVRKYEYAEQAPNRVPNAYVDLRKEVKELMFLPTSFKKDLIKYFEDWAENEAFGEPSDNNSSWLGIYDPLNFDPKIGLELGNNGVFTSNWKQPNDKTQFTNGYGGYIPKGWRGNTFQGNKIVKGSPDGPNAGGIFPRDKKNFNIWFNAYAGDNNTVRTSSSGNVNSSTQGNDDEIDFAITTLTVVNPGLGLVTNLLVNCFTAGQKVKLSNGSVKNIEDITEKDSILTYDLENKEFKENKIEKLSVRYVNKTIKIYLENGITISCTPDHPFYVKDKGIANFNGSGFRSDIGKNKQLFTGDELYYYNEKNNNFVFMKIKNITEIDKQSRVFNLIGLDNHKNYIVNNVLAHTDNGNKEITYKKV